MSDEPRDEILLAFHQACPCPTAEQIIEWTRRHPQYAEDIRGHAAIARDWAAREGFPVEEPDEEMLERGRERTLNALREAKGFAPLTHEEAHRAYDEAPAVPISDERIKEIVDYATGQGPGQPLHFTEDDVKRATEGG